MAQSPTRICQRTLVLLGTAQRLSSLDDGSVLAQAFRDIFDECRDELLAEHPWNFAVQRRLVAVSADYEGDDDWAYGFELPANCLRWLPWAVDHVLGFEGVREGRFILANEVGPLNVRYIERVEDAARWSPGYCEALAGKLAMWVAPAAAVQSDTSAARAEKIYETALSRGRRMDALENGDNDRGPEFRSNWLGSRESSGETIFGRRGGGGGGGAGGIVPAQWGAISGDIANQEDLGLALAAKQPLASAQLEAVEDINGPCLVHVHASGGAAKLRKADATAAGKPANGFVLADIDTGEEGDVYFTGAIISGLAGLEPGETYYLDIIAGGVTDVAPIGNVIQQVGVALSDSDLLFAPLGAIEP